MTKLAIGTDDNDAPEFIAKVEAVVDSLADGYRPSEMFVIKIDDTQRDVSQGSEP